MATFSVLTSLLCIVILQRLTKRLFLSMVGGFFAFILLNSFLLSKIPFLVVETFRDKSFLTLILSVIMIYFLEQLMSISKDAENLSLAVKKLFKGSSKAAASFLASVIGLLPVPSGAMFSAPIVAKLTPETDNLTKTAMNYWFRHTLEFFWPMYPAMYLLSSLISKPLGRISANLFPLFLISFVSGWIKFNGFTLPKMTRINWEDVKKLWPVFMILSIGVAIVVFKIDGWIVLLIACTLYGILRKNHALQAFLETLKRFDILGVLFVIFLYKHAITDFGIGEVIGKELTKLGNEAVVLSTLAPLLVGMSTGITSATVGITVPLLISLDKAEYALLTYIFAVLGVLLSPVHLCLVLTAKYFQVDFLKVLKRILLLVIVVAVFSIIMYAF
ncbi:DUF401 family protein [Pseudothermotoga thermarum]|uniref:DUF401 family protein n=1 Tax=Pseudothermotoga thermarum DSM 5069 TaxID=688269 RepID=F7YY33_9THEM|nr:DUF401 family protein [Pseudothermotoga thermarum]AEH50843.1 protein of unknown function DUF401 [Pseudothermotoga thermarum DSM 5069]